MSVATEITRLQTAKSDLKAKLQTLGIDVLNSDLIDSYASKLNSLQAPLKYPVYATTVRISASTTENYATSDLLKIWGSDGNTYTLGEWNDIFVENGYSTEGMITPKGIAFTLSDFSWEALVFNEEYLGANRYTVCGTTKKDDNTMPHSMYAMPGTITGVASGTDSTTNLAWTITDSSTAYTLYTANTKLSFTVPKGCSYGYAWVDTGKTKDWTDMVYNLCEWYRHRFAISTSITTEQENGTIQTVLILNSSGELAAIGEDMYFWITNDLNELVNTNLLAKYNLSNIHASTSASLNTTYQSAIYDALKAAGINMNDTGVSSSSKKVLWPGSKGAEAIAVDGIWKIITPYISQQTNATYRFGDAPAVYYAKYKNLYLPSTNLMDCWYFNNTLVTNLVNYLKNKENRSITLSSSPSSWHWCAGRLSTNAAWIFGPAYGYRYAYVTCFSYRVLVGSGL